MKGGLTALLLCCGVIFSDGLVGPSDTDAMLFDGKKADTLNEDPYLRVLEVQNDFMLVGAREMLYNISLRTMQITTRYRWFPSGDHIVYCTADILKFGDCHSYVRSVRRLLPNAYLVCASSSRIQLCRKLVYNTEENKWEMDPVDLGNPDKIALAPLLPWNEIHVLVANDTVYVAGHNVKNGEWCPIFYRGNTYNQNNTDVGTYDDDANVIIPGLKNKCSNELFSVDFVEQTSVKYAAIAGNEHYVYLTFSEPALETYGSRDTRKSIYSRIARVCKNDMGRGKRDDVAQERDDVYYWATLFKARMLCGDFDSPASGLSDFHKKKFIGYYPQYIDEIADSAMGSVSSVVGADGEEIILAIFNSQSHAANQAAVCAYRVSDVNKVFASKGQIQFGTNHATYSREAVLPPAQCHENSTSLPAKLYGSLNHYLLAEPVLPINSTSLFISNVGYRMTRMAVDWQVEDVGGSNGSKYDVMFVATDDGRLIKLVSFVGRYEIIEERQIFPDGSKIFEMQLVHDEFGKKHLLLNSLDQIKRVSVEKCHFYTDCRSCIELRDPYCSWSPKLSRCVSTTHEATDKYQSITTGSSSICSEPTEYSATVTTPKPSEASTTKSILAEEIDFVPKTGAVKEERNDTTYIALLIVLPIVVGVIAAFLGYMYGKRRYMSQTPHIDRELTTIKGKDEQMCDPYQSLPKPSNLQLMNNLTHQVVPNSESTSTLTRQKKVYV